MLGRTHILTGVAAGLAFATVTGQIDSTPVAAYGVAGFCALLPDLDQAQSFASRYAVNAPAHAVLRHFRHRRFTHSLLGVALFAITGLALWAIATALFPHLSLAWWSLAVVGYVSHLVADAFNKQGIQIFYPFSPFGITWWAIIPWKPARISTIHDAPDGVPYSFGRIQARLHTEKWFFCYPVELAILYLAWHGADGLLAAARTDITVLASLPAPIGSVVGLFFGA